jgi:penicillin-binding protein 1A
LRLRRETGTPRRRRRIRKLRFAALLLVLLVLATVAFAFGFMRAVANAIPPLDPAAQHTDVDTVVYASNGRSVLAVLRGDESRVLVDTAQIAPIMRQAIVSIEDQRFFEHHGIDLRGIARALWADIRHGSIIEGGSTITQQFVKNAYIRNERTFARKIREAALAWQLEQRWSKDRILTAYLNTIYFGNGAYGIQQAARAYFGKSAKNLTLPEAALLAGIPSDPSLYDPVTNPRSARDRRREVLAAMLEQAKITHADYARANAAPLPRPEDVRLPGTGERAPYFVNYVKDQLVEKFGAGRVFGGGLHVTTTIDLGLQKLAREAVERVLPNPSGPAAALVAIDPRTGAVKAMYGGRSFRKSQFNLATQGERQPGSSFKPIVLATAMREGIAPATELESHPVSIDAGDRIWHVTNYDHTYLGQVSLWQAMVSSDNSVYAQLTDLVGPNAIVRTAHALGIETPLKPYFSIGLGSEAVDPLEMARAYASIADGGRRVDGSVFGNQPRVVERVERVRSDQTDENLPVPTQVMDPGEAELETSILQDVVRAGTGTRAAVPGVAVAGKTGTTDNWGDAWFVGYTPELVVAVWVGYPNKLTPMLTEFGGQPVTGGTLPALIWKQFVSSVETQDSGEFAAPPYLGAVSKWVVKRSGRWLLDNGHCRGAVLVDYFVGRGPEKKADCKPNEVSVPLVVGMTQDNAVARLSEQPLGASLVYEPARAGRRPGLVVKQMPRGGGLSAHDNVTLVISKALHGLVPNVVGSSSSEATRKLRRLKLRERLVSGPGPVGIVLRQSPAPGVAAAPGLTVTLLVANGSRKQSP